MSKCLFRSFALKGTPFFRLSAKPLKRNPISKNNNIREQWIKPNKCISLCSHFTLPESLIDTANVNGQTAFTGLAKSYNQTDTLNNTPDITYFIPNNGAFAMQDSTNSYATIEKLLLGHLIPNFAGYLPTLSDGATYRSQGGSQFTLSIRGNDYYVNNAKIVLPNVVLENGVAHVIDQV
jgi:uncharacterized surface protein with fasciclin (FAS1) repeats